MSKRGLYIGGHSREHGSPKMGYVGDHPFAYLKAKKGPKKKQPLSKALKAKLHTQKKKVIASPIASAKKSKDKRGRIRAWRSK